MQLEYECKMKNFKGIKIKKKHKNYTFSLNLTRVHLFPLLPRGLYTIFRSLYESHTKTSLQTYNSYTNTKSMVDSESPQLKEPLQQSPNIMMILTKSINYTTFYL